LFVIARNSSLHYKGRSPMIQDVGRELGVRWIVEGSVRKAGNRVRITAQLIDAMTGAHVWAERYDRSLEYAAWGFLGDTVREYSRLVLDRVPFGEKLNIFDLFGSSGLVASILADQNRRRTRRARTNPATITAATASITRSKTIAAAPITAPRVSQKPIWAINSARSKIRSSGIQASRSLRRLPLTRGRSNGRASAKLA
jgi:hypothetical protein